MPGFGLLAEDCEVPPFIRVPGLQNTTFKICETSTLEPTTTKCLRVELVHDDETGPRPASKELRKLHYEALRFTDLSVPLPEDCIKHPETDSIYWEQAYRAPMTKVSWPEDCLESPSIAHIWIVVYLVFSIRPELALFTVRLRGPGYDTLSLQLDKIAFARSHPAPTGQSASKSTDHVGYLAFSSDQFWMGAGSPNGDRPIWLTQHTFRLLDYIWPFNFSFSNIFAKHPVRPKKPKPGSTIYTRYIPHLQEEFSMVAIDWTNKEHINYFHNWQNDPRVAQGWNETGTLEEHTAYLRKIHDDPHQFSVLGKFDDSFFAYFEIYWAKEDLVGAYYAAGNYDRGRHFLVGDGRFRGPHRVKAWHTSLTHYMFLDDLRTHFAVGEPRASNEKVLEYDKKNGYKVEKFIDLPHKRAALVMCPRYPFLHHAPFHYEQRP